MTVQESLQQQLRDQDYIRWAESSRTYTKHLITNKDDFHSFLVALKRHNVFAYDTETNGTFNRDQVAVVGLSFCFDESSAFYIPVNHFEGEQLPIEYVLEHLRPLFESEDYEKVAHNAKFDEMVLQRHGINVGGIGHDTLVMAWMLSEDTGSKGLKQLTEKYWGVEMETYQDVISAAPKKKNVPRDYNFARVSLDVAKSYAADDAYYTLKLFNLFKPQLEKEKLWVPYSNIDRQFVRVLRNLEARGVYIDQDYLNLADERLPKLFEEVEASIYEQAGEVFNIGSGKQLGNLLFEKLGIGDNVPTTDTGNYKTDKKTLEVYASQHKIVEDILRRKKISKTHSVFVQGLKEFIGSDGKVHPSFNGCGTVTGRLSCSSPNLQQIEGDEVEEIRVRNFFVPSPGYRFVVADYGQIELRVMAHLARDETAIKAFLSGRDFHDETARTMFKLGPDEAVAHRQRFTAKSLNFGIPYGRGPSSVGEVLGITAQCQFWPHYDQKLLLRGIKKWYQKGELLEIPCEECAKCFIEKWWDSFPQVKELKKKTLARAKADKFVRTISGRKRRLPDINSGSPMLRSRAERQAFNTVIQGSAADIIKLAMIALSKKLPEMDAHMCLQIHDELVIEAPTDAADIVLEVVKSTMENPLNGTNPLRLPLIADPKIVDRWGDAK